MKAIIIGDGKYFREDLPFQYNSLLALPVLNLPIIDYLVDFFSHELITDIGVIVQDRKTIAEIVNRKSNVKILTSASHIHAFVDTTTIVIPENIIPEFSLFDLGCFYRDHKKQFTMILSPNQESNFIAIFEPETLRNFPSIISICQKQDHEFLWRSSIRPLLFDPIGDMHVITNWDEYYKLNMKLLLSDKADEHFVGNDGFWVSEGSLIHKNAYIIPPVLIGNNSKISSGVYASGPLIIGDNVIIEKGASLSECIVLESALIKSGASLAGKIIGNQWIEEISSLKHVELKKEFIIK